MTIERVLTLLQTRADTPERARELASMGYMQWLGSLPGCASYEKEAMRAWRRAQPFAGTDPAVAVFCEMLQQSIRRPAVPLDLPLPQPQRRGGARKRRLSI
ncbi:hypothetical protein KZZ07_17460 [Mameliella sp. CS4]|uniref:hypothetical protein n=1 Tax=Mameliella sp. CS4 TaxID=2862329 RepID=UPI001C5E500D|nr:hypothetical protein [Mameliella sp. CS4]MBW4984331.1 hypothetical protein [Mameliella sp. CS4]